MAGARVYTVNTNDGTVKPLGNRISLGNQQLRQWPRRGTSELLKAYSESPWVRALFGKIGDSLVSTEWQVLGPTRSASARDISSLKSIGRAHPSAPNRQRTLKAMMKAGVVDVIEQHPLPAFVEAGNALHSGKTMMKPLFVTMDLVGEGFQLVERANNGKGDPVSWSIVPPQWVKNVPVPGGRPFFKVIPDGYGANGDMIPATSMVWILEMDPWFPYGRGTGIGASLSEEIDAYEFSSHHIVSALQNGAVADLVVMVDGAGEEAIQRFEDNWKSKLKGWLRKKVPIFLNKEVKMEKISQSNDDLQFAELREAQRDVFLQSIGIPPEIMGVLENSNRATITSSKGIYQQYVLVPRCDKVATAYQRQLLPMFPNSESMIVGYVSPVEEDQDFKLSVLEKGGLHSAHTVDEWRELSGHSELPQNQGKVFVHGLGLVASDTPAGNGGALEDDDAPDDEKTDDDKSMEVHRAPGGIKLTKAEAKKLAARLGRKVSDAEFAKLVGPQIAKTVADLGQRTLTEVAPGLKFDVHDKRVANFLKKNSLTRAKKVGKASRERIRNVLASGVRDGNTLNEVVPKIMDIFKGKGGSYRALRIGVTESTRAANFGTLEGMRQGGVEQKEWLSVRDDAVRDTHKDLDGQRADLGEDFTSSSGATGPHPGAFGVPEEDINCRCTILAVVNGENGVSDKAGFRKIAWKMKDARRTKHQRTIKNAAERALSRQGTAVKAELDRALAGK